MSSKFDVIFAKIVRDRNYDDSDNYIFFSKKFWEQQTSCKFGVSVISS